MYINMHVKKETVRLKMQNKLQINEKKSRFSDGFGCGKLSILN